MTAPATPEARRAARNAAKKPTTATDLAAMLMRAARRGLQIVPVSLDDWSRVIGANEIDGSRVRLVLDGNTIWLGEHASTPCLQIALQEADPNNHPYLVRPNEVVEIGHAADGRTRAGKPRVLRRTPIIDLDALPFE
ncbi:hypothetical protein [Actinophytocola oryzae]|uniref:Uncharacterized protein n=1 Tax=Actinophytocola oryzae TaxID=502181 RepID=A0A4V3FQL7_9PSEU|nr:hypothetical protein [Actinophytocola oryzae]TDV40121.1 hypothetical protein CLV71_124140 [Actinophytocola oryzae]